ncbi:MULTISPECIES: SpoIIE family protein phosphatase [Stenotrophomonas]|uniref:SpoIIE family protein phosphatase n=2 Tax=Lysobacteraceae TaxID=32033 RepID=UPI0032EC4B2C
MVGRPTPLAPTRPAGRSLRTRLMLWSSLVQAALLLLLVTLFYLGARTLVHQQATEQLRSLADQTARSLGNSLRSAEITGDMLLSPLGRQAFDAIQLDGLLRAAVVADPNVDGATVIIEPDRVAGLPDGYACNDMLHDGSVHQSCSGQLGFDTHQRSWYRDALRASGPWWSAPYTNPQAEGRLFITYSNPLRLAGELLPAGLVSVDVPLARLQQDLGELPRSVGLRATLLGPDHRVVLSSVPEIEPGMSLQQYLQLRPDLAPLFDLRRPLLQPERGLEHRGSDGTRFLSRVAPLQQPGWQVVLSADRALLLADLRRVAHWAIGLGLLGVVVWLLLVRRHALRLLQPMEALTAAARRFSAGQFHEPLPVPRHDDEVGEMARSFESARRSILQQMDTIARMASARERTESEMRIAHGIQQGMLAPPPRLQADGFQLRSAALLVPAREVGGDFQHIAQLDRTTLCFVIGDVSGNGVPAALFMTRVLTVLEASMLRHRHPPTILAEAGRHIAERNQACMFATVLCGVVDVASGRFELASAGHESPLLRQADGRVRVQAMHSGPALGISADASYPCARGLLAPGDYLLAYTDGISEAQCPRERWFGLERLREVLAAEPDDRRVCARVVDALHAFCEGAGNPDDLALVSVGRQALAAPLRLRAAATPDGLAYLLQRLVAGLHGMHLDSTRISVARLIVEELGTNAMAYQRVVSDVTLDVLATLDEDGLALDVRDDGQAFDPTVAPVPDLDEAMERRAIGGWGLHLVRSLSDHIEYCRRDGSNHVHLLLLPPAARTE